MKKPIAFLLFLMAAPLLMRAQNLIPEEDLDWTYKYSAYELADVDPDSVYGFYEYGSVYSPEDFTDEDEQLTTDLLACRNLQILELHNIAASDVLSQLDKFPYLQVLVLDNVGMSNIPDGIYTLQNLKQLSLSYFTEFYMDAKRIQGDDVHVLEFAYNEFICDGDSCTLPIASFPKISKLTLKGEIYYLPESMYTCTELVELDLSDCELEEVGYEIGDLTNLESLNLARNYNLSDLPEEIGYLENLRTLDISGTGFYTLPLGLENCSSLETIDASYSSIEEIPDFIGNLTNLYSLSLNGCTGLSTLPLELKNCSSLYYLNIYSCGFTQIPQVIGQMTGLGELDLSYNYVSVIPSHLKGAKSLFSLDLSGNNIEKFEPGCFELPALYKLRMGGCGLNSISPEIFKLTELGSLDLSYDSITEVPAGLYNLTKLHTLYLEYNQIKTMAKGISKLVALNDLNVSNNALTALPKDLTACINIGYLNLADNKVKKFPKGMSKLANLMYLDARGNKNIVFKKDFKAMAGLYEIKLRPGDLEPSALVNLQALVGESRVYLTEY